MSMIRRNWLDFSSKKHTHAHTKQQITKQALFLVGQNTVSVVRKKDFYRFTHQRDSLDPVHWN